MKKSNKRAFTIVELVIVIAVISILAAVLIPTFTGIIKSANKSADEQEVASINIHLAMADKISSEADLAKVIDDAFGAGTYATLSPRSAQYGYHYWYDVKNNAIVLKSYQEITSLNNESMRRSIAEFDAGHRDAIDSSVFVLANDESVVAQSVAAAAVKPTFAESEKDSFRMFDNYYILDNGGSVIGEALSALKSGDYVAQKVKALTDVKTSSDNKEMADALIGKLERVAVVGNGMTFVYNADLVTKIYFAPGIETVSSNVVFYNESNYIAKSENIESVVIPDTVKLIEENALIFEGEAVELLTSFDSIEEIAAIFQANSTNGIIVGESGVTYTIDGGTVTGSDGSTSALAYGNAVESFEIVTPADTADYKTVLGNMYVAYNYSATIQLGVDSFVGVNEGAVSSEAVIWESDNARVFVSEDGKISIVGDGVPAPEECIANITATAVAGNGVVSRTLTVNIVRPVNVEFTFATGDYDMTIDDENPVEKITVTYDGSISDFAFTDFYEDCNVTGMVDCDTDVTITAGAGVLFEIKHNGTNYVLTLLNPTESENETQQFTVTVGSALTKTFEVSVNDISAEPFEVNAPFANPSFLYRVGNGNDVTLGLFFDNKRAAATSELSILDVSLGNAPIGSNPAFSAKVNGNASDNGIWSITSGNDEWKGATIRFSGTGVAKIQLGEVFVIFEIVDGLNATSYGDFKSGNNIVMLDDITISNGSKFAFSNTTLYGNDFTFDVSAGNYNPDPYGDGYHSISENYVVYLNNGTLDNVRIVGKVFTGFSATTGNADNICNVLSIGNNKISNCHISYCSAPVRLKEGNLEIVNTTLMGGSIANLDIRGGNVTLDNVTTINQKSVNGTPASEGAVGFGVIVWYEGVTASNVTVKNTLTQYNYMSESDFKSIPLTVSGISLSNTLASAVFNSNSGTGKFIYTDNNGAKWINTGIFSMTDAFGSDNLKVSDFSGIGSCEGATVSYSYVGQSRSGYLFSTKTENVLLVNPTEDYVSVGQGVISPSFTVDNSKNAVDKTDGSNEYCYYESGTIYISFDDGDSKVLELGDLCAAEKGTNPLILANVYLDGVLVSGSSITFDSTGDHVLTFKFDDPYNYDISGNSVVETHSKSINVSVSEVMPEAKHAEFTFGSANLPSESITINNATHLSISKDYATGSSIGSIPVGDQVIYYPIVESYTSDGKYEHGSLNYWEMCFPVFKGAVTITDYANAGTGAAVIYDASTTSLPANLIVTGEKNGNYEGGPTIAFKYQASSNAPADPANVSGVLCYKSPTLSNNARSEMNYVIRYQYTDNVGATYYYYIGYHCPETTVSSGGCVTPDTLVTLADGTQKEIQYVTYEDQLLVWNFYTGEYDVAPAAIIFNMGTDNFNVLKLAFEDGTTVKTINGHRFFDKSTNGFVLINTTNVTDYIGHEFVKVDGDGYTTVKLVDYSMENEYTTSYSIMSGYHYNFIVEGMFSDTFHKEDAPLFDYFKVGSDMMYDAEQMQADIEAYGLYTYDDFAEYLTYEQFVGFNVQYFKIAVGRGEYTYEGILDLIEEYLKG